MADVHWYLHFELNNPRERICQLHRGATSIQKLMHGQYYTLRVYSVEILGTLGRGNKKKKILNKTTISLNNIRAESRSLTVVPSCGDYIKVSIARRRQRYHDWPQPGDKLDLIYCNLLAMR